MPLLSTLGAASSRGFGEFIGGSSGSPYVEDNFNTTVYTGNATGYNTIQSVALASTTGWTSVKSYPLTGGSWNASAIAKDSSGNIIQVGNYYDTDYSCMVAKVSTSGSLIWARKLSGGSGAYGNWVAVDSSDNIFVVGSGTPSVSKSLIAKYNSSGTLQWQRYLYSGSNSSFLAVAVGSSGNVYACGAFGSVGFVAKYNTSGTLQWQRTITPSANEVYLNRIAVDSSDNVYMTGQIYDGALGTYVLYIVKYNSSGTLQWQKKMNEISNNGRDIAVDSSGNIYIGATVSVSGANRGAVLKLDSTGASVWQRTYTITGSSEASAICVDSSANSYLVGYTGSSEYPNYLVKFDSSGTLQWERSMPTGGTNNYAINSYVNSDVLHLNTAFTDNVTGVSGTIVPRLNIDGTNTSGYAGVYLETVSGTSTTISKSFASASATDAAGAGTDEAGDLTGSSDTLGVSLVTQPSVVGSGMVWIKGIYYANSNHALFDTDRGVGNGLFSNLNSNQYYDSASLTRFAAYGFGLGDSGSVTVNSSNTAAEYVAWSFRRNPKFFDVVTYTGDGTSSQSLAHGLNSDVGMILVKTYDPSQATYSWAVYHGSLGTSFTANLDSSSSFGAAGTDWGNTTPTTKRFYVGSSLTNSSGVKYVAYLFATDTSSSGQIVCGTYTGSASGASIDLGWEPQFVLLKPVGIITGGWSMFDCVRGFSVQDDYYLQANTSSLQSSGNHLNPTATGFSTVSSSSLTNGSADGSYAQYVYMAIRRGPMRVPTDGSTVFLPNKSIPSSLKVATSFPADTVFFADSSRSGFSGNRMSDSLRGCWPSASGNSLALATDVSDGEGSYGNFVLNARNSAVVFSNYASTYLNYAFRRAPYFYDVVCYSGTGSTRTVSHNLKIEPELLIVKARNAALSWTVYAASQSGKNAFLDLSDAFGTDSNNFGTMTSSTFQVKTNGNVNGSGVNYVAYLFGTAPGVSKVGSFTGNGSSQNIDCGFTTGARFVMIKRASSSGSWFFWDSARGIIAGNDPHLEFDTNTAQVTTDDSVDPLSSGFTVNQVTDTNVNVNGETYVYLAIA